jgi:hypothetical protein
MDIRSVVFDLIDRDVALRAFGVAHARRGQHDPTEGRSNDQSCFIVLEWAADDRPWSPAGAQLLTIRAHLPRERMSQHLILDFLLQRLRAVLSAGAAGGSIMSRHQGTSSDVADSGFDTVFKSSTFQVAPRQPTSRRMTQLRLVPWTVCPDPDPDAVGFDALSTAHLSLN